jgi:hypothetical protein
MYTLIQPTVQELWKLKFNGADEIPFWTELWPEKIECLATLQNGNWEIFEYQNSG